MDNHIRHPEAERSDNTEPQSHLRLLNSREQVKWSASIMLSLNWRNQAFALRTPSTSAMAMLRQLGQEPPPFIWRIAASIDSSHSGQGLEGKKSSSLPVEGGIFSLTFPFIDQAITLTTRSMSEMAMLRQQPHSFSLFFGGCLLALECSGVRRRNA